MPLLPVFSVQCTLNLLVHHVIRSLVKHSTLIRKFLFFFFAPIILRIIFKNQHKPNPILEAKIFDFAQNQFFYGRNTEKNEALSFITLWV